MHRHRHTVTPTQNLYDLVKQKHFKMFYISVLIFLHCAHSELTVRESELSTLDMDFVKNNARHLETYNETRDCETVVNHVYQIKVIGADDKVRTEVVGLADVLSVEVTEFAVSEDFKMTSSSPLMIKGFSPKMNVRKYPRLNCYDQRSDELAKELMNLVIHPPPNEEIERDTILQHYHVFSENQEDKFLDKVIFKGLENGFFVEAGAADFVFNSNSLNFEVNYNWSGLLVEVYPHMARYGLSMKRNVWAVPYCLALKENPHYANISKTIDGVMEGVVPDSSSHKLEDYFETQCFPLYSLLKAIQSPTVNLLVLDIEGAEFEVLKHVPWDSVEIEVMLIETDHAGKVFPGSREDIIDYLDDNNYQHMGSMNRDDYFVRKDLMKTKYKIDVGQISDMFPNFKIAKTFLKV